MRYRGNSMCPYEWVDERTNAADGQSENIHVLNVGVHGISSSVP